MFTRSLRCLGALLLAALFQAPALADDTDLFASPNSVAAANILVIFDNAASFDASAPQNCGIAADGTVQVSTGTVTNPTRLSGTSGGVEQCALYSALKSLSANTTATFNISFMMFNATKLRRLDPTRAMVSGAIPSSAFSDCPTSGIGGCAVVDMVPWNPTVKASILEWIRLWDNSGNSDYNIKVNGLASGAVQQEAWAFLKGKTGISGQTYTAPTIGCGKNFVIYVGNAYRNNTSPSDQTGDKGPKQFMTGGSDSATGKYANPAPSTIEKATGGSYVYRDTVKAEYGVGADKIVCTSGSSSSFTFSDNENGGLWGLNWALYMWNQHDIKTTSIGLLGSDCLPEYSAFLERLAAAGGGDFYATKDYDSLRAAFASATGNIISANSVFASVSLPVSVNTQGSYLNQVFVGMFRPDDTFNPRWYGNLKQYKLGFVGQDLKLVDAATKEAINTNTGFIKPCARSFWTPGTTSGEQYWALSTSGDCTEVPNSNASDYPDGNIVEKGAQAYVLRQGAPASRVVKTCGSTLASCLGTWTNFDTTIAASTATFKVTTTADRDLLINWARGQNTENDLQKGTSAMRPSAHGDVMHSRPVAVNHGTAAEPNVVVYYGANDGLLHSVNGNQTRSIVVTSGGTTTTFTAGQELWSFMPSEFYGNIKRIYDNVVPVFYKGTQAGTSAAKPYGMDGPVTAVKATISGAAKVYVYAAMRRGGRALYAFDVTTPTSPAMLWKIGCTGTAMTDTDCGSGTKDYSAMGQTWSPPKVMYASAVGSGTTPLILMGGGYDTCEDTDGGTGLANHACASSKGNRVYVIDGTDGTIVREFPTVAPFTGGAARGVVGEATIVSANGIAKYAYIADLGGVVYRLDFTGNNKANWSMTAIAKLGCDTVGACTANRKFMFQPSVVSTDGETFQILLGSGDREKPTSQYGGSNGVTNYFFMLKDKPADSNYLNNACAATVNYMCLASLLPITTATPSSASIDAKMGWYLGLQPTEQVVTGAITQFGITTFSTHQPAVSTASCTNNLGTTLVYNVSYKDASPVSGNSRFEDLSGDGLPPSPVAGKVLIDGTEVPFCIGCSKDSPLEGKLAKQLSGVSRAKSRLYWYLEKN